MKIIIQFGSCPTRNRKLQENSKIIEKIKKKNTIMASFPAKVGWKRLRNRENKNYRSVPFQPDA